jgi:hypothetical protein
MQQWLNLLPIVGILFNLATALTNLTSAIINRRKTSRQQGAQQERELADSAGNGTPRVGHHKPLE